CQNSRHMFQVCMNTCVEWRIALVQKPISLHSKLGLRSEIQPGVEYSPCSPPDDSGRREFAGAMECSRLAHGASGSVLYLRMGARRGARISQLFVAVAVSGI